MSRHLLRVTVLALAVAGCVAAVDAEVAIASATVRATREELPGARHVVVRTCTVAQLQVRLARSSFAAGSVGGYLAFPPGSTHGVALSAWLPALNAYLPACTHIEVSMIVPASDLRVIQ